MRHFCLATLVVAVTGFGALIIGASLADQPAGAPAAVAPTSRPAAAQGVAPLDVAKFKFAGLLGDTRFRQGGTIEYLGVTRDGKRIISEGNDWTIRFWDSVSGKELHHFDNGGSLMSCFVVFPDGKQLACATWGKSAVTLWDLESGQVVRTLVTKGNVSALALTPDGQSLFAGDAGGRITQWNLTTGRTVRQLTKYTNAISTLDVSPDGKRLVSDDNHDGPVIMWDIETGKEIWATPREMEKAAFSPSGEVAIVGTEGIRVVSAADASKVWVSPLPASPASFKFNADGSTLAVLGADGTVHLLDGRKGAELRSFTTSARGHGDVAFTRRGDTLLAGEGNTISQWDVATGQRLFPTAQDGGVPALFGATLIAVARDGSTVYSTGTTERGIAVWDVHRGMVKRKWPTGDPQNSAMGVITSLCLSADNKKLLVGTFDHHALVFDTSTGASLTTADVPSMSYCRWTWGPGERTVIGANQYTLADVYPVPTVAVCDLARGTQQLFGVGNNETVLAIRADAKVAVTTKLPKRDEGGVGLTFWSLIQDATLATVPLGTPTDNQGPRMALFLPDGPSMLTVSGDNKLRQWSPPKRGDPPPAAVLAAWVRDLGSDDFNTRETATTRLVAAGPAGEAALRLANLGDPEVVARVQAVRLGIEKSLLPTAEIGDPLDLENYCISLAVHPDGKHWAAVTGSKIDRTHITAVDRKIVVGDLTDTGPKVRKQFASDNAPATLEFTPDGKTLYVGNGNATISIYRAE